MVALADLLRSNRSVDLPLIVLPDFAEHREQHDQPLRSTPVSHPAGNVAESDPQLPDRTVQVVRPRAAQLHTLLREHPGHLVDSLEVAIAQAVQPGTNLRFDLEVVHVPSISK